MSSESKLFEIKNWSNDNTIEEITNSTELSSLLQKHVSIWNIWDKLYSPVCKQLYLNYFSITIKVAPYIIYFLLLLIIQYEKHGKNIL